jgi:hypothetical protein
MMQLLCFLAGVNLYRMERRDLISRIKEVIVQRQDPWQYTELIHNPCSALSAHTYRNIT